MDIRAGAAQFDDTDFFFAIGLLARVNYRRTAPAECAMPSPD
jgi:hypothetical protein